MGTRTPMRARNGFTLLEVLVAFLILGIMAAVAAPALLSERTEPAMVEAEGRIDALFRLARDSAIVSAMPVTVVMDSMSSRVWLDVRGGTARLIGDGDTAGPGESLELPASVRMRLPSMRTRFTFLPTGAASGDSIVLEGPAGDLRIIRVNPWTGRSHVR